ncbi:MAG: DNA-3-methyladenine glycosylase 2 family protein, partial [Clostridia bacterium]|nr:DNA-3-methyladenine glycosylase 2 family protein [Clostridia bacterium]
YNGIRILKQDEWETICSFIISQNNNIPRIKKIIENLCETFGEKCGEGYSFPKAETLAKLEVEDLDVLRAGFRSKYILDAAQKIASGKVDLEAIKKMDFENAKSELIKIKGVGEKVAQCSLLYGFARMEAFPVDVWVKRIVSELYPEGLPECINGTQGIAQQYLFHWRRNLEK